MIGPNPVSSSRTTTLATSAVEKNMKKREKIRQTWIRAAGELTWTLDVAPIWIASVVTEP